MRNIVVIFLCVIGFFYLLKQEGQRKVEKQYNIEHEGAYSSYIKYDMNEVKAMRWASIISFVFCFMSFLVALFFDSIVSAEMASLNIIFLIILLILFLICLFSWISGAAYLKELKKWGYEVPANKAKYNFILANVPRTTSIELDESDKDKECIIFSVLSMGLFLLFLGFIFAFYLKWNYTSGTILVGMLTVGDLIWLIIAARFFVLANNSKYKCEFSTAYNRKNRPRTIDHVAIVVVFAFLSALSINMANSMTRYVTCAGISADVEYCEYMESMGQQIYDTFKDGEDEEWIRAFERLEEGYYIVNKDEKNKDASSETIIEDASSNASSNTSSDASYDVFEQELLAMIEVDSFKKIEDAMHLDKTTVFIKLEGDEFKVIYENPHVGEDYKPI